VPFFVRGRNALVEGIGERIQPIDVPTASYAVVKPAAHLDTGTIFRSEALVRDTPAAILSGFLADPPGALEWAWQHGRNDLQPPAEIACQEVAQAARWLEQRFGNSRMTGSGSGVFARAGAGDRPGATFPAELPSGWVGRLCRSLEAHPLVGWASD
jgi:4-diphosphocytidyl-2-C-methyl-D-erythritol kinase